MREVPVVICGAGPVGLTAAIMLSRRGIPNLVVERRTSVSGLPRARGIMSRTVEIWSQFGLYDEMTAVSLPPHWCERFLHMDTLAGEIFGVMPSNSMSPGAQAANTAYDFRCAAQDQIDSMLFRCASAYPQTQVVFNTELTGVTQDNTGVTLTLRLPDGSTRAHRAQWLVAADGGRGAVRDMLGVGDQGHRDIAHFINNHFSADLSLFTKGREATLHFVYPEGGIGSFQSLDGKTRWMCQIRFDPVTDPAKTWTPERVVRRLKDMVGDPRVDNIPFNLHSTYAYSLNATIADRLRVGRVLMAGDAAHRIPPVGGIGMNTGVQTAHNAIWKLAAVIKGEAPETLLDTIDPERREVAQRACDYGRTNMGFIATIQAAKGREAQRAAVAASKQYGNWVGLDLGVHYETPDGAFIDDGSPFPPVSHPVIEYIPTAKPGYRAPHLWLRQGDRRFSSVDLFEKSFVLLAASAGQAWATAARALGGPTPVQAFVIGPQGDLLPESDFEALYGLGAGGAVLVRPDGHVAWRSAGTSDAPSTDLRQSLDRILRRAIAP
jgi:putative polyketide hydroxylase